MRLMIKAVLILAALAVTLMFAVGVGAEENISDEFDLSGMTDGIDYDAGDFLDENGITPDDPSGVLSLDPWDVLRYMWEKLIRSAAAPVTLLRIIISVVMISAVAAAAEESRVMNLVTAAAGTAVVLPAVEKCIESVLDTVRSGGEFMLCYVPVFAGVCTAAGNITSAAAYSVLMLSVAEAAVSVISSVIIPAASAGMAFSAADACDPMLKLSAVTEFMKTVCTRVLGFVMCIFTGVLSIQTIVGSSADGVGVKAAKFVVSNCIPIVGGAVADAYSTVRSGLTVVKGTAGAFGMIALGVMLLPPLLEAMCLQLALRAGKAVAELFGVKNLSGLFGGAASALSMITASAACFGVMFIISTMIMMSVGNGTGG